MLGNKWFDAMARPRICVAGRILPSFQVFGLAGFAVATIIWLGGGVLLGYPAPVMLAAVGVVAGGFFGYASLRKAITKRESHSLFEQLWLALLLAAAVGNLGGLDWRRFLDLFAAAAAAFLAIARLGCLAAGCCHGSPAGWGIVYRESRAVPRDLLGVRLAPVQAIESVFFAGIATICLVALPVSPPGRVLTFLLMTYSVARFTLEELRGGYRTSWLGVTQGRWFSVIQFSAALILMDRESGWITAAGCAAVFTIWSAWRWRQSSSRRWTDPAHIEEVRSVANQPGEQPGPVRVVTTSLGAVVAITRSGPQLHVSLSGSSASLPELCRLASVCWSRAQPESATYSDRGVLQLVVYDSEVGDGRQAAQMLRHAALSLQKS